MEYTEYVISFMCRRYNWKWTYAYRFLKYILFVRLNMQEH